MRDPRRALLEDAADAVVGPRADDYGPPEVNLGQRTARLWTAYLIDLGLGRPLDGRDVSALMILLKLARLQQTGSLPEQRDSWVDVAGYAATGWTCVVADRTDTVPD
jgi:hypothetical protein